MLHIGRLGMNKDQLIHFRKSLGALKDAMMRFQLVATSANIAVLVSNVLCHAQWTLSQSKCRLLVFGACTDQIMDAKVIL